MLYFDYENDYKIKKRKSSLTGYSKGNPMNNELERLIAELEKKGDESTVISSHKLGAILKVALRLNQEVEAASEVIKVDFNYSDGVTTLSPSEFIKSDIVGDVKIDAGDLRYLITSNAKNTVGIAKCHAQIVKLEERIKDTQELIGVAYSIKEVVRRPVNNDNIIDDVLLHLGRKINTTV